MTIRDTATGELLLAGEQATGYGSLFNSGYTETRIARLNFHGDVESAAIWQAPLSESEVAQLTAVPEPAGLALLMGTGGLVLGLRRRP